MKRRRNGDALRIKQCRQLQIQLELFLAMLVCQPATLVQTKTAQQLPDSL